MSSTVFKKKGNGATNGGPDKFTVNAKVKMLKNQFPELSDAACEDVLFNCGWSVEDAKSYLSNTRVKFADDRTYTPRQSREFDRFEFEDWSGLTMNDTERNFLNNGGYKTYPPAGSASNAMPALFSPSSLIKPKSRQVTPEYRSEMTTPPAQEDWEFVFKQMSKDERNKYVTDLHKQLESREFARVLWTIFPYPGKQTPKTLIILRGVSGSGKSTLANLIVNSCGGGRSLAADDFFMDKSGKYNFVPSKLQEAHTRNQKNCASSMEKEITPIVIDNTNTQEWEALPYVKLAIQHAYFIEILEPSTAWKKNPKLLAVKNVHQVPKTQIQKMLNRYEENITVPRLVKAAGHTYEEYLELVHRFGYIRIRAPKEEQPLHLLFGQMNVAQHEGDSNLLAGMLGVPSPILPSGSAQDIDIENGFIYASVLNDTHWEFNGKRESSPSLVGVQKPASTNEIDLIHFDDVGIANENVPIPNGTEIGRQWSEDRSLVNSISTPSVGNIEQPTQDAYQTLRSKYPEVEPALIDEIFDNCKGNLIWASDILMAAKRNFKSLTFTDTKPTATAVDDGQLHPAAQTSRRVTLSRSTSDTNSKAKKLLGGDTTNTMISHSNGDISKYHNEGAAAGPSTLKFISGPTTVVDDSSDENDLFVSTDGTDWFDMQLDTNFVKKLSQTYKGYEPSSEELKSDSLKIRVPPELAFELFQYYSLGLMENSTTEVQSANTSENLSDPIVKDLVEMDEITASGSPDLKKLMEIEARLSARDQRDMDEVRSTIPHSLAAKLAIDELQSAFPKLKRTEIETVYALSGYSYEKSMDRLTFSYPDKKKKPPDIQNTGNCNGNDSANGTNSTSTISPVDLRQMAYSHHRMRVDYANKLASTSDKRSRAHYSERFNFHTSKMDEYNAMAADVILAQFQKRHGNENDLDLHHLYVNEALQKLKKHLEERRQYMKQKGTRKVDLRIITGRGNNSVNGAGKLAPAVKNFLKNQHYSFLDCSGHILVHLRANEF